MMARLAGRGERMGRRVVVRVLWVPSLLACLSSCGFASGETRVAKRSGPPSFFLQDVHHDGLCLGDGVFKRCGIDTLWYVEGKPGSYEIHRRKADEDVDEDLCLDRASCGLPESAVRLGNCKHCGARKWNILGDAEGGYALTEDGGTNCVVRDGAKAKMELCSLKTQVLLSLQFSTRDDIAAMESDGARLVALALDGDERGVRALLKDGVDVDARGWDKVTALIAAATNGHEQGGNRVIRRRFNVGVLEAMPKRNAWHASSSSRGTIARPKMSHIEWKPTELRPS